MTTLENACVHTRSSRYILVVTPPHCLYPNVYLEVSFYTSKYTFFPPYQAQCNPLANTSYYDIDVLACVYICLPIFHWIIHSSYFFQKNYCRVYCPYFSAAIDIGHFQLFLVQVCEREVPSL